MGRSLRRAPRRLPPRSPPYLRLPRARQVDAQGEPRCETSRPAATAGSPIAAGVRQPMSSSSLPLTDPDSTSRQQVATFTSARLTVAVLSTRTVDKWGAWPGIPTLRLGWHGRQPGRGGCPVRLGPGPDSARSPIAGPVQVRSAQGPFLRLRQASRPPRAPPYRTVTLGRCRQTRTQRLCRAHHHGQPEPAEGGHLMPVSSSEPHEPGLAASESHRIAA